MLQPSFEGMESIIAWWRLQCRKDTGDAHATQDTSGPQTIVVRENHCHASEMSSMTSVTWIEIIGKHIYTLGQFRTIIDKGKEKTCMSACVDQTFDVTVSTLFRAEKVSITENSFAELIQLIRNF